MARRVLFGFAALTALVVVSIVSPALGAPSSISAVSLGKKVAEALDVAKAANKRSKKALNEALDTSKKRGPKGATGVTGATGAPGSKGPQGDVARWTSATVATAESINTNSPGPPALQDLATPGPQVSVTVPASGLVEVFAQADISGPNHAIGGVGLRVDGATTTGAKCGTAGGVLIETATGAAPSGTYATASDARSDQCGTAVPGLPGSLMLILSPGQHTLSLAYYALADDAASHTTTFSNRRLNVTPRP